MPPAAIAYVIGFGHLAMLPAPFYRTTESLMAPIGGAKYKGEKMNAKKPVTSARLSKNGKYVLIESNGQTTILNANLMRYLFDIPYTRKDGTHVSVEQIFQMKTQAQAAYDQKAAAGNR